MIQNQHENLMLRLQKILIISMYSFMQVFRVLVFSTIYLYT